MCHTAGDEFVNWGVMASYLEYARASRRLDELDRKLGKAAREEACLRKVSLIQMSTYIFLQWALCNNLAIKPR